MTEKIASADKHINKSEMPLPVKEGFMDCSPVLGPRGCVLADGAIAEIFNQLHEIEPCREKIVAQHFKPNGTLCMLSDGRAADCGVMYLSIFK